MVPPQSLVVSPVFVGPHSDRLVTIENPRWKPCPVSFISISCPGRGLVASTCWDAPWEATGSMASWRGVKAPNKLTNSC